jgi:SAM-dependent methyltransferase
MDLRRVLALPKMYSLFADVVGGDSRRKYVEQYIRPFPGARILDIGCGPADLLDYLPPSVQYTGFDASADYIDAARKRFGARGSFFCERVNEQVIERIGQFDIAIATGVLHHLDDADAVSLFRIARHALVPGGRLVTLDGCYTDSQSRMARYIISKDRGEHVRADGAYETLARQVFPLVDVSVRHDLMRIPYTHVIMQCAATPAAGNAAAS